MYDQAMYTCSAPKQRNKYGRYGANRSCTLTGRKTYHEVMGNVSVKLTDPVIIYHIYLDTQGRDW